MAPKSILKSPSQAPSESQADRNLELAFHHARLIQHRKDTEALVLSSTETLLDFPSSSATDPAEPTADDESRSLELLQPFRPSDLDSLVEERNIDNKCGYLLCQRRNRKENTNAKYRILRGNKRSGEEMKIVEKAELERWCSDECGKRALYLRVQLSDTPAWERTGGSGTRSTLKILRGIEDSAPAVDDQRPNVDVVSHQLQQLAMERGDVNETILSSLLKATVIESHRSVHLPPQTPFENNYADRDPGSVEGYVSRLQEGRVRASHAINEGDDIMDTI